VTELLDTWTVSEQRFNVVNAVGPTEELWLSSTRQLHPFGDEFLVVAHKQASSALRNVGLRKSSTKSPKVLAGLVAAGRCAKWA